MIKFITEFLYENRYPLCYWLSVITAFWVGRALGFRDALEIAMESVEKRFKETENLVKETVLEGKELLREVEMINKDTEELLGKMHDQHRTS